MNAIPEWTEGVCGDGAAILRDGVMVPVEQVIETLNSCEKVLSLFNVANVELSNLVSEALDLCTRARKLDNAIPRPGNDPLMPRSATPALWVQEQYDNDLAAWDAKARAALGRMP